MQTICVVGLKKLPVSGFKWKKKSKFTEEFIKSMMKIVIKDIFLK